MHTTKDEVITPLEVQLETLKKDIVHLEESNQHVREIVRVQAAEYPFEGVVSLLPNPNLETPSQPWP